MGNMNKTAGVILSWSDFQLACEKFKLHLQIQRQKQPSSST